MTSRHEDRDGNLNGTFGLRRERRSWALFIHWLRPHSGALPRLCHVCTLNTLPPLRAEQAILPLGFAIKGLSRNKEPLRGKAVLTTSLL